MEKEVLVEVNNVSKKFCKDLKTSLRYGLKDSFNALLPGNNSAEKTLRKKEFWAVQNISFTLRRGECIGLIGHNGAGKSTLLKVINGLIKPDAGSIKLKGKIGALIELGAGFNPILTGRENIYNNAAVLGFSKKEIDAKMDAIIAFSEIEEFLDMPVQNYSSGMKVRLGFAIAAHLEPDVLIVDEVLAVGDLGFVLKCFKSIDDLLPNTAMIFVSHSMPMVSRICNQIILLEKGEVKYQGADVSRGIDLYYKRFTQNDEKVVFSNEDIELESFFIETNKEGTIEWGNAFNLSIKLKRNKPLNYPIELYLEFKDKEQRPIAGLRKEVAYNSSTQANLNIQISIDEIQFSKGIYSIDLVFKNCESNSPVYRINNFANFQVTQKDQMWVPFNLKSKLLVND
jgi:lipopolysaccharide transport system ATP-binding protein